MDDSTTKLFAENGATVYGIDINEDALKMWAASPNVVPVVANLPHNGDTHKLVEPI